MRYFILVLGFLATPAHACVNVSASEAAAHLATINAARSAAGLDVLVLDPSLSRAAQAHACDMAKRKYFGHTTPDGRGFVDRMKQADLSGFCRLAENIARGQHDIPTVMGSWMRSPGHRANLLDPKLTHVGLGRATGRFWVQVFGGPC